MVWLQKMEMEDEQQQLHRGVIGVVISDAIARLEDPLHREERHKLSVEGLVINEDINISGNGPPLDRQSLQHLVDFLDNADDSHEVVITELELCIVEFVDPSDGGLQVLRTFFSRSDTTLTKVTLRYCNFGSQQDASMLLSSFGTNRTVLDLTITDILNLEGGAALGNSLSGLIQNMPQLQRLDCSQNHLGVEGVRPFQPALKANRTLTEFNLNGCRLGDEGIRLVADALVGNTIMDNLDIGYNEITPVGLDDIARLIELTRLQTIDLHGNQGVFGNESSTRRFARVLSRHEFLKKLNLSYCQLGDGGIHILVDGLVSNTIMEALNISWTQLTSAGLADIACLLESTQLKTITLRGPHYGVFNDEDATQHFVSTLHHKNSTVQEIPGIYDYDFPEGSGAETYASIKNSLTRNQQLNRVNLLLVQPSTQQQQRNAASMMLKIWHKAITKFAKVPNNAGASAIFKLFTARPQLLEKRLKRPATATAATCTVDTASFPQEQKRRRL